MYREQIMRKRHIVACLTVGLSFLMTAGAIGVEQAAVTIEPRVEEGMAWYNVAREDQSLWGVEGRGWTDVKSYFDRLPAKAEGAVRPPVWQLSRHSAGMAVLFETDSQTISARYGVTGNLARAHMTAVGMSGVDLYARDADGVWRWVAANRPSSRDVTTYRLTQGLKPGMRAYCLYLPLYNAVTELEIGVPEQARFTPLPPRTEKPIVFYGTSIMHGCSASRPGMAWPAILGRHLDHPTINLGFSGNGRMDPEVGELMAELDASVYVIDCLPNMDAAAVAERAEPFVRTLREARPDVPIILVEDRTYADAWIQPSALSRNLDSRAELKKAYQRLKDSGVAGLYYVEGDQLMGDDNEATIDSSHPTDLGMMRQAEVLEPVLREATDR